MFNIHTFARNGNVNYNARKSQVYLGNCRIWISNDFSIDPNRTERAVEFFKVHTGNTHTLLMYIHIGFT